MALAEPARLSGRRTVFQAAFTEQAGKLARLGASNAQLADFFGIDEHTLLLWRERYSEFSHAVLDGRARADTRALKGDEADKFLSMALPGLQTARRPGSLGLDPTACILWLRSHQPKLPANAAVNSTRGKDDKPTETTDPQDNLSKFELARRVAFILQQGDRALQELGAYGCLDTKAMTQPSS